MHTISQESGVRQPVLLLILDGWGLASPSSGGAQNSAIELAHTPVWDRLWKSGEFPTTRLIPHGEAVGLTHGQMGNSEVGHLNIGAGRVVYQDLVALTRMIQQDEFRRHVVLNRWLHECWEDGTALHLVGLFSDGGVHSHIDHMYGLIEYARYRGVGRIWIHAILDGRDTAPRIAERYFEQAEDWLPEGVQFATVSGRYYAMDRDHRWERIHPAWEAIAHGVEAAADGVLAGTGPVRFAAGWTEALSSARQREEGDEFVQPTVLGHYPGIFDGEHVFFFNFRSDRMRQLVSCFTGAAGVEAPGFDRGRWPVVRLMSSTHYRDDFTFPVLLDSGQVRDGLVEVLSAHGLSSYKLAETEKYAHVTYFFNGGREQPWPGEERVLVASPKVATYDLQPQMSLPEVTDYLVEALQRSQHALYVVNFANGDMVGHTGVKPACIAACAAVDKALERVLEAAGWGSQVRCLITADHGNCDQLAWPDGTPHTQHSMNDVPVVLIGAGPQQGLRQPETLVQTGAMRRELSLCDLAPTVLELLGIRQPESWNGQSLLRHDN